MIEIELGAATDNGRGWVAVGYSTDNSMVSSTTRRKSVKGLYNYRGKFDDVAIRQMFETRQFLQVVLKIESLALLRGTRI